MKDSAKITIRLPKEFIDEIDGMQRKILTDDTRAILFRNVKELLTNVIKHANAGGIKANVAQQFEIGRRICDAGLVPIIEPEVDIHCPEKAEAEAILQSEILNELNQLGSGQLVMLKLTLPEEDNLYKAAIDHPNVVRVVALSGGYSREEANDRLSRNNGMVASFSRALSEGLNAQQSDDEFNAMLDASIDAICQASKT